MAYQKNTWKTGDKVTAEKLNNMEQGIADANSGEGGTGNGAFVVTMTDTKTNTELIWQMDPSMSWETHDSYIFTIQEIDTGLANGATYAITYNGIEFPLLAQYIGGNNYIIGDIDENSNPSFANVPFVVHCNNGGDGWMLSVAVSGNTPPDEFIIEYVHQSDDDGK